MNLPFQFLSRKGFAMFLPSFKLLINMKPIVVILFEMFNARRL